mmetsp:Transcript_16835/g.26837  ORF Transcript_16835/g.26837 Transcript_16835/m.26837 type:complete len:146 (-) Transcript_16835:3467-3904(-)
MLLKIEFGLEKLGSSKETCLETCPLEISPTCDSGIPVISDPRSLHTNLALFFFRICGFPASFNGPQHRVKVRVAFKAILLALRSPGRENKFRLTNLKRKRDLPTIHVCRVDLVATCISSKDCKIVKYLNFHDSSSYKFALPFQLC